MKVLILMFLFRFLTYSSSYELNKEPIIGILSIEISPDTSPSFPAYSSLIPASYVKAVESSGARVVPVVINKPKSYYENIVKSVNGLVLPGGGAKNGRGNPYYESVRTVYNLAKELNENGTVFPILGVCLGYEFLITAANDDVNLLHNCSIFYENYPINFIKSPSYAALYSRLTSEQRDTLENYNSTMNWHIWCAYVEDFRNSVLLNNDWVITSTSTSTKGVEFIASAEHKKYPFYGIQFHPEKVAFEWKSPNLPRGEKILLANRYFYDQLVFVAKSNNQTFSSKKEERDALIYNYPTRFDTNLKGAGGTSYTQLYLF
ncbi:gamma-glutamyl hydrolase-like [Planococcus citri]|uniref:gamma-glutamyl hydrolase-like n=1 Tax=Planococcus citri TaxID=170843 RepID=UPI0031F792E1